MNSPVTFTLFWRKSGILFSNNTRISVNDVTRSGSHTYFFEVVFSSLSLTLDSGQYTCEVSVSASPPSPYITGSLSAISTTYALTVERPGKHCKMLFTRAIALIAGKNTYCRLFSITVWATISSIAKDYEPLTHIAILFQFQWSNYRVSEAAGSLVVCVQLVSGYLSQQINVTIHSQNGTAKGRNQFKLVHIIYYEVC